MRLVSYALADDLTPSQSAYDDAPVIDRHLGDLARFVDRASRGGVPVWIVPFDLNAGLEGPPGARYRRFVTAAEERGLPVLSLEGAFEGEDRMALWVNRLDAHPNARAHGLAAEWLAPAIADDLSRREEAD